MNAAWFDRLYGHLLESDANQIASELTRSIDRVVNSNSIDDLKAAMKLLGEGSYPSKSAIKKTFDRKASFDTKVKTV